MALPILDGNQSATTLSTILAGGEHTPAHTVVSLGSTAISNITSAVSGSVVSISNFPATQPISGSISISGTPSVTFSAVTISNFPASQTIAGTVTANLGQYSATAVSYGGSSVSVTGIPVVLQTNGVYGGGLQGYNGSHTYLHVGIQNLGGVNIGSSVTMLPTSIGNSVTIGSLPAISGTVTANGGDFASSNTAQPPSAIQLGFQNTGGDFTKVNQDGASLPIRLNEIEPSITVPISGTVTVGAMPNGSLTTRFGTPTTASVAFATTAVTNASRKYLLIQNVTTGSNVITVGIGFTPTTTQGIQLTAGAGITFESSYIPTGAVYVLSSVTASNFTVLEA